MDTNELVRETKALIAEVERGETDHAAWVAIQDRVRQLQGPGTAQERTKKEVAGLLDKTRTWVIDVLRWDPRSTSAATPFSRASRPGRREGVQNAEAKRVARENPEAIADAIKSAPAKARKAALKVLAEDEKTQGEVIEASSAAIDRKRLDPKRKPAPQTKTRGALDAHGAVIKRAGSAAYQAKLCLDEVASVDEPLPADLIQSALEAIDNAQAEWELVKANLRGETVGDQAAEFLANQ